MNKNKKITKGEFLLSMVKYSLFILVYWISFYELYTLCKFGRINNNIAILFGCMLFFLASLIILIIKTVKKRAVKQEESVDEYESYSLHKTIWTCITVILIVIISGFYGVKIYHSGVNYNGKLSWLLSDIKNKKTVKLEHINIYKDGIEGIFTDINKKVQMPEKLYVTDSFKLDFDYNGNITSFDTYLYGKNSKGKVQSYLISYSSSKSGNITIQLNGVVNAAYSDDKLLDPLVKTMKVIDLKKTVSNWPESRYGILYYGKRSFGYNSEGIVNINSEGKTTSGPNSTSEIVGYTVSVYVPGKENKYTPVRYNLTDGLGNLNVSEPPKENKDKKKSNPAEEFYLSEQVGYRLQVTDAAAGSRFYCLNSTSNGGATWKTINADPFSGSLGVAAGVTFLNDKLGFICLSHSGGANGELYRTEDGGVSFKKVSLPAVKATLNGGQTFNPFDLPAMPYEKDGILNVLVGQGADGDYNGGSKALYQSKDQGKTWQYIKEVN